VHVKAFYDADGNGVGDFAGLTESSIHRATRVDCLWICRCTPRPLKTDGYDIRFLRHPSLVRHRCGLPEFMDRPRPGLR